jgi:predicted nuclease of predicted toxin-antitoxin system
MIYLADENFPGPAIRLLRERGFDVIWIRESSPGITDEEVILKAIDENRVLLTFDKDFGEMAHVRGLSSSKGVVLFRISTKNPAEASEVIMKVLSSDFEWVGYFSVITASGIRSIKC